MKLREVQSLSHLIDVGGCTLHTIANANKHACETAFATVSELVDDVYAYFNGSLKRTHALQEVCLFVVMLVLI